MNDPTKITPMAGPLRDTYDNRRVAELTARIAKLEAALADLVKATERVALPAPALQAFFNARAALEAE